MSAYFASFSVYSRVVWYLLSGLILTFFIGLFIAIVDGTRQYEFLMYLIPLVLIFLLEWLTTRQRKKLGLKWARSYLKTGVIMAGDFDTAMGAVGTLSSKDDEWITVNPNYYKDLVAEGESNRGVGVDKNDLGYWYGLYRDGAITEAEYAAKKEDCCR